MIYRMEGNRLILTLEKPMTLAELFTYFSVSKKQRHLCRMNGSIRCAGKIIRNDDHLLQGEVTIDLSQEQIDWVISDTPSQLVYSSPFLLVVHKPAGCIIHGNADDHTCLNARVAKTCVDQGISCSIRPIHRLDQDTCGLVVYSRHSFFQPWLDEQLAEKKIYRHYQAICFDTGRVSDHFPCNNRIGRDRHVSGRYRISPDGKDACTHFDVLARKNGYVLIGCRLETGRTHQIRVHLAHLGHPLTGDFLYGQELPGLGRPSLHSWKLALAHPVTGEALSFCQPLPPELGSLLAEERAVK